MLCCHVSHLKQFTFFIEPPHTPVLYEEIPMNTFPATRKNSELLQLTVYILFAEQGSLSLKTDA